MRRSKYFLGGRHIGSCDMGELVPVYWRACLPGDTIQARTNALLRVSPLLAPVMHKVTVRLHHWFVPYRLIWPDFEKFITGGPAGEDATEHPVIDTPTDTGFGAGSLGDYLGLMPGVASKRVSALPFRAFNLIYNKRYRDQDLGQERVFSTGNGLDTTTNITTVPMRAAWKKDYWTQARPTPQKGPSLTLPIPNQFPILRDPTSTDPTLARYTDGTSVDNDQAVYANANGGTADALYANRSSGIDDLQLDLNGTHYAFNSPADAISVPDMRNLFALQRYRENRSRFGSRYTEYLQFLGVKPKDARLQDPEYLGGGKSYVQFSEVMQTAPDADAGDSEDFGVAEMKGHGVAHSRARGVRYFTQEHGIFMTLMSIVPDLILANSVDKEWYKLLKEDYWQKELEHVGQQPIRYDEVQMDHTSGDGDFGWVDRYEEYRVRKDQISAEMRTSELDFWHMAKFGTNADELNQAFIECVPTKRVHSVQTRDAIWFLVNNNVKAKRLVSRNTQSYVR